MSEKTVFLDDGTNTELVGERLRVGVTHVTNSGDVNVGTFDFADYNSISTWAATLGKDLTASPPKADA